MTRRNACMQRPLAWIALFAIALLTIVPSVQQLLAARATHDTSVARASAAMAHADDAMGAMHHGVGADDPCQHGPAPGDPWHKCGYCDFLAHAPVLASVPVVALLAAPLPPIPFVASPAPSTDTTRHRVAQPRGPPLV